MRIVEVTENKKQYLDLLLLADEQEDMVDRYLYKGKMYVLDDDGVKCECVVTDEGTGILEIKNIATVPPFQRKGYAKALIEFLGELYNSFTTHPYQIIPPMVVMSLLMMSFNLVADGLREALDPKMKSM